MNRQKHLWRPQQEIAVEDTSLADMTPEQRLAGTVSLVERARALLDNRQEEEDDEITDAAYEEVEE